MKESKGTQVNLMSVIARDVPSETVVQECTSAWGGWVERSVYIYLKAEYEKTHNVKESCDGEETLR